MVLLNGNNMNHLFKKTFCLFLSLGFILIDPGMGFAQNTKDLMDLRIRQRLDDKLPLETFFRDEENKKVPLKKYFKDKPVILTFVYYTCPKLCSLNIKSLVQSLKTMPLTPGKDYQLLVVSFDPRDNAVLSLAQKKTLISRLGSSVDPSGIHFLSGNEQSIHTLTKAAGFSFIKNEATGQYAHPAVLIIVTPEGLISRYLFGIDYRAKDIRLALSEAGQDKIGSLSNAILLYCFVFNPHTGRYTLAILNILKIAAGVTVVLLGGLIFLLRKQEKSRGT